MRGDPLRLVAGVERASEHPLGLAIVNAATDAGLSIPDVTDLDAPVGKGVMGTIENGRIRFGSANFLTSVGLDPSAHDTGRPTPRRRRHGHLRRRRRPRRGDHRDRRPGQGDHPTALEALRAEGIEVVMLTVTHPRRRVAAR